MSASQTPATAAELEALSSAFGSFVKVTEELRGSYERLRERADKIDVELASANEKLRQKVDELDHLTGHLNGILAAIPSGVVVSDSEGRITAWNGAAEKILASPAGETVGRMALEIQDADGKPLLLQGSPAEEIQGGRERRLRNGNRAVLGGGLSPIRDGSGRTVGTVEIVEDLTELWNLRERVHQLDKLAALGEMSAVIAHEIRNPLNGIQGFADLLGKNLAGTDPKMSSYATNIVRGVREVDAIISDLLSFASPERFFPSQIDLEPVIRMAGTQAFQAVDAKRLEKMRLSVDFPAEGIRVAGDPIKLGQIFRNLFSNSLDAMPEGGEIRVCARKEGNHARVTISDEGPGIPEEARSKVFDPFFTTKTQGTGLGLAIVRKLMEMHGGKACVVPSERGARFDLTLPKVS